MIPGSIPDIAIVIFTSNPDEHIFSRVLTAVEKWHQTCFPAQLA